jgi:hypothetical protein
MGYALGQRIIAVAKLNIEAKDPKVNVHSASHWRAQHTQTGTNLGIDAAGDEPQVESKWDAGRYDPVSRKLVRAKVDEKVQEDIKPGI